MADAPESLDHPTFGRCKRIPGIVAVRWAEPHDSSAAAAALRALALAPATEIPTIEDGARRARGSAKGRDPRRVNVNNTDMLTFASGTSGRKPTDAALERAGKDEAIEWVGPVYQANSADAGLQSYFAIDPTMLILSAAAVGAAGDLTSLAPSASIDQARSRLLKGYTVLKLPNGDAIAVARQIAKMLDGRPLADAVLFENIPYISPLCGCSCGGATHQSSAHVSCSPTQPAITPNDTFFAGQWGLQRINAPRAWPISEGDPNLVIAVLDEGIDLAHPDINLWPLSYSTITHTNNGNAVGSHGTACAGIISGRIDNGVGVAGLAGKCRVMAIATYFSDVQVAEGLYFAADNGARVVSMSFGVYPSWMMWNFAIIEAALQYCHDKKVVLVAASGNENINVSRFPGSDPRTLCVGGSNRADVRKAVGDTSVEPFWGACYGPDVEVVAPCLEIPTTDRLGPAGYVAGDYDMMFDGTSSATPHVAGLAGLILSVNPALDNVDVRRIICETTDKINAGGYAYLPTGGKPYGTWTSEVGYGRINAERALLVACAGSDDKCGGPCCVDVPVPDKCCVSPCDPPWRPDEQCMVWYETKFFRVPLKGREIRAAAEFIDRNYIEFRITYEHRLCLLGKQHGPLAYTVTLLPGEKVTLYHSDRYRRITSTEDRFSVQTTFMQFFSAVHQARTTNSFDALNDALVNVKTSASVEAGGGLVGLLGGPSSAVSVEANVTDHNMLHVGFVSDQFNQSLEQSSQLTHAERSVVVSTYEDRETADITARTIQNDNACRAVTYFVRKVLELYAFSSRVSDIVYRIVAPNVPQDWHTIDDLGWLPGEIAQQVKLAFELLPKVGDVTERPKPISLPTDGLVYDPELANCCSCEPERAAAIAIQLEKQKAEALKACLDVQILELELQRRKLLLQQGTLTPFDPLPAASASIPAPALVGA